jgi:transcriptional regulator with PAS, ATPase and Fis domain
VGAREPEEVDVRIVAATHRALRKDVESGRFRADLMYRLRVIPVFIPPLHARGDDVVLLAERFIEELNLRSLRRIQRISQGAKEVLLRHDWPGNVRELRNAIEYAFAIGDGPVLVDGDLPSELLMPAEYGKDVAIKEPLPEAVKGSPEAVRIIRAMERARGSRAKAAQILGISRVTLWRRMKDLGLG